MNLRYAALLCLACWAVTGSALAQEQASANRATELKERPAAEARTLAPVAAETTVKVLARQGAWTQVEVGGQQGWVRAFHLRFRSTVETASSGSSSGGLGGLAAMVGIGRKSPEASRTAALGIRGLTPDDFRNASPDAAALRKLQSYRADRASAERFAQEAKLAAVAVPYPKEGS
jgi:uncharacterized protein YgiM (DUF1202 family)